MRWKGSVVRGHQAIAEHEPIIGSGGRTPSGVQGQSPWSGGRSPLKLKAFWSLDVGRFSPFPKMHTVVIWGKFYVEIQGVR